MGSESIREGLFHNHIHIGNFSHCQTAHMSNVDDFAYDRACKTSQSIVEFLSVGNKDAFDFLLREKAKQFGSRCC